MISVLIFNNRSVEDDIYDIGGGRNLKCWLALKSTKLVGDEITDFMGGCHQDSVHTGDT